MEAAYDRWAASYDACDNPMVFMASAAIAQADFGGCRVFEFGCGTGRNLAALRERDATAVAGCDLSDGMLAVARRRCPDTELLRHDMTGLPVAGGSFDAALFSLSLEHVKYLPGALAEARRIVRPGGRISIFEIHPYLSLGGTAAHFEEGGDDVRMPTVPHQFADYLRAFAALELRVAGCRETGAEGPPGGEPGEGGLLARQLAIDGIAEDGSAVLVARHRTLEWTRMVEQRDPLRFGYGQSPPQDLVEGGKHGRVRPDPEGERQHGNAHGDGRL